MVQSQTEPNMKQRRRPRPIRHARLNRSYAFAREPHAAIGLYGEFEGRRVDRDEIDAGHFRNWIDWAKANRLGLDFNPTCFAHPKAADGFTLSHPAKTVRQFWIEHCSRSREIGASIGEALGTP